ncbi:MAG TPA: hypothetical protein DCG49_04205 [Ruminococcus sp.]|nr:hypothetical protein [Ruminococcus sp.]
MTLRITAACVCLSLLTFQLPSCNFTSSVDTMLRPPRLTLEQEQIYQALQTAAASQIILKYPKSGEHLSAFTVADLDQDGSKEAIVFYETGRTDEDENPLRMCLLDQKDGKWNRITEWPAAGAEIERVDIGQLGSNDRTNLIVSYSMVDGAEHAAEVFHYADGMLYSSLKVQYSVMALRDLDLDGTQELFIASAAKAPDPAAATVYALNANGIYKESKLELPETFTDISRLVYGMLPDASGMRDLPAVYMDGITGATAVRTLVLNYHDTKLSLIYSDSGDRMLNTERPGGWQAMDIDGDDEVEIPVNMSFYGYQNPADAEPLNMTNWYVCRNGLLMREHSSYYSLQNSYVFLMPKRWERCVTAVREDEEIVFYEYEVKPGSDSEESTSELLEPLLRIAVVTDPIAADAMQQEGYLLLRQNGGSYYLAAALQGSKQLSLSDSELVTAMKFL